MAQMSLTLQKTSYAGDEDGACGISLATSLRFRFAPTFVTDLSISIIYAISTVPIWIQERHLARAALVPIYILAALIAACYLGKILIISYLHSSGGDARLYVRSSALVTRGPYEFSRNPTYLLTLVQFLLWSVLMLYFQCFGPLWPAATAVAIAMPILFFLLIDRVFIPREEAALQYAHPRDFDAYSKQVNRWVGRSRPRIASGSESL